MSVNVAHLVIVTLLLAVLIPAFAVAVMVRL